MDKKLENRIAKLERLFNRKFEYQDLEDSAAGAAEYYDENSDRIDVHNSCLDLLEGMNQLKTIASDTEFQAPVNKLYDMFWKLFTATN